MVSAGSAVLESQNGIYKLPCAVLITPLCRALGAVSFPNEEIKRRVSVDYVDAAGKAFASAADASGQKMQIVLLSGALVVQDQSQTLYFLGDFRRLRARVPQYNLPVMKF